MKLSMLSALLLLLAAASSARAQDAPPDWVDRGSGVIVEGGRQVFRGVGAAQGFKSRSFAAAAANLRACDELGKMLSSRVTSLDRSYALESEVGVSSMSGPGFNGRLDLKANKSFENADVKGAMIAGRWRDSGEGAEYSLCVLAEDAPAIETAYPEKAVAETPRSGFAAAAKKAYRRFLGPGEAALGAPSAPAPKRHVEWVTSVAFSPDGGSALSADNKTIALLDGSTGRLLWAKPADADFVAFSKDGGLAVAAGADGLSHAWDTATGSALTPKDNVIRALARDRDYLSGTEADQGRGRGRFEERDISRVAKNQVSSSLRSLGVDLSAQCAEQDFMEFTMGGARSSEQQLITLKSSLTYLDAASGATLRRRIFAESTAAGGLRMRKEEHVSTNYEWISADGKRRLVADTGGALAVYGPDSVKPVWSQDVSSLSVVARSPDGRAALVGSSAKADNLMLWDLETGKNLGTWTLPAPVTAIAFSPDGAQALVGLAASKDNLKLLRFPAGADGKPGYGPDAAVSSFGRE